MRQILAALAVSATFSLLASAEAAGPWRQGSTGRMTGAPYNKQAAVAAYGRAVYPKYYWGLHSREFQNIGVPHGDIGIRGNDLSLGPW
ncbi:MAG TPA: hypothetical protein VK850_14725 [Candidatus Binatia bacterium]|nr:hypothetical protein [Pirellulaceae bacterium]HTD87828.1 hypothetical protein [Candidatus Binatia bacterium]